MKTYYVYIITNKPRGTLYIGVTSNLVRRIYEHKNKLAETSFSKKYDLDKLVYFEATLEITSALELEKRLKRYNREWKINLINKFNPIWEDLYSSLLT